MTTYNTRSPAVKRLMREAQELRQPTEFYYAQPLEDNLFEWHFTIRGQEDSDFAGGIYHGRIYFPTEYPLKPPNIILLTPNGRFETYRQICLSISGYHPETWRPSWSIRTVLLAIIGFMPTSGAGAIGALDMPSEERRKLAASSLNFTCDVCGPTKDLLLPLTSASTDLSKEASEVASQLTFRVRLNRPLLDFHASTNRNSWQSVRPYLRADSDSTTRSRRAEVWHADFLINYRNSLR
ncbi:unnamed protein product [Schistocephalus solidus]|uniref:UBIQUITIN_CONJUGAT_2 domain-containing protein n=1 Tax=Schistocephalus solidus TaxID=70667 RepID=A0A183SW88_SCHSO|nr:unnamed protein product [Schistocephalus solidus]